MEKKFFQRICILGSTGKMGLGLLRALQDTAAIYSFSRINDITKDAFSNTLLKVEGVIDFSHRDNLESALMACAEAKKPYFCGTTNLTAQDYDLFHKAAKYIPVMYTPNTSIGIAIVKKAIRLIAKEFGKNMDIAISEVHHHHKKDSPSGTSLSLANVVTETLAPTKPNIQFASIRGGQVVGKHTVHFFQQHESIEIKHECLDRQVFVDGAIQAASWLFEQEPGFYTLEDMLNNL